MHLVVALLMTSKQCKLCLPANYVQDVERAGAPSQANAALPHAAADLKNIVLSPKRKDVDIGMSGFVGDVGLGARPYGVGLRDGSPPAHQSSATIERIESIPYIWLDEIAGLEYSYLVDDSVCGPSASGY